LQIAVAFALTPLVVVMVFLVSAFPNQPNVQTLLLALTSALWLFIVFRFQLPHDAEDDYTDLRRWLTQHRSWLAVSAVPMAVVALLTFEDGRLGVLAVQASLLLWPFSVVLYQTRRFVSRAWRFVSWGLGLLTATLVLFVPLAYLFVQGKREETVRSWVALLVFALPPVIMFAGLFWLRADWIEDAVRARMSGVGTRGRDQDDDDELARRRPRGGLALLSIACALLSSLLLLGSAIRVPLERRLIETSQVAERGASVGGLPFADATSPTEAERLGLYERYFPVLRLHEGERWIAYNASTALETFEVLPREDCAGRAQEPCGEVAFEKNLERLPEDAGLPEARVFPGGAVYPNLISVRSAVLALDEKVPGVARDTEWLLQYWLFYPNNAWEAKSAVGSLVQTHGGDWEWIGIGLDRAAAPLFVAYSAHCAGTWRPWSQTAAVAVTDPARVIVGGDAKNPPTHPLVIVALGSHANYATPGTREPDWGSCRFKGHPVTAQAMRWLTFIIAAREETPDLGSFQVPKVLKESDTERDAGRPLWWGEGGQTKFGPIEIAEDDHGPASPIYQREAWANPIDTIFDSNWECDAGKEACESDGGADDG